ncbi:MAG: AsmA family protein [Planctomycetota bacterium]|jgi:hypothetical protein
MTEKQPKAHLRLLLHPYFITLTAVVILAALLVWSLGHIIDAKALRKSLEDHISYRIGADVTIAELETELSFKGIWKIRLRDITVSNNSPDFGPELFICRKLVFEGSIIDLIYKKWKPKILFKDWALTIGAAEEGRTNISDLFQPRGSAPPEWDGWPFSNIFSGKQEIELENGTLLLKKVFSAEEILTVERLNGNGSYTPLSQKEFHGNFSFALQNDAPEKAFSIKLDIKGMKFLQSDISGKWDSDIKLTDISLKKLSMLAKIPGTNNVSKITQANFKFNGTLDNRSSMNIKYIDASLEKCEMPVFGVNAETRIIAEKIFEDSVPKWKISLQAGSDKARHSALLSAAGVARSLSIESPYIDFTKLSSIPKPNSWEAYILKNVSEISAKAERYIIFGLVVDNAEVEFILAGKTLKSKKLSGKLAGGEARLDVKNWIMGGKGWPAEIGFVISRADAPKLFSTAAHILPSETIPPPFEGSLSLALLSPAGKQLAEKIKLAPRFKKLLLPKNRKEGPAIKVGLIIDSEMRFDTPGQSALFKALWDVFPELQKLEQTLTSKATPAGNTRLSSLRLKSGQLLHSTIPGNLTFLTEGSFDSVELGQLAVKQKVDALTPVINSVITLKPLTAGREKNSEIKIPDFSAEFRKALEKVEYYKGFNFILSSNGRNVEKLYLNDIIRRWQKKHPAVKGKQK